MKPEPHANVIGEHTLEAQVSFEIRDSQLEKALSREPYPVKVERLLRITADTLRSEKIGPQLSPVDEILGRSLEFYGVRLIREGVAIRFLDSAVPDLFAELGNTTWETPQFSLSIATVKPDSSHLRFSLAVTNFQNVESLLSPAANLTLLLSIAQACKATWDEVAAAAVKHGVVKRAPDFTLRFRSGRGRVVTLEMLEKGEARAEECITFPRGTMLASLTPEQLHNWAASHGGRFHMLVLFADELSLAVAALALGPDGLKILTSHLRFATSTHTTAGVSQFLTDKAGSVMVVKAVIENARLAAISHDMRGTAPLVPVVPVLKLAKKLMRSPPSDLSVHAAALTAPVSPGYGDKYLDMSGGVLDDSDSGSEKVTSYHNHKHHQCTAQIMPFLVVQILNCHDILNNNYTSQFLSSFPNPNFWRYFLSTCTSPNLHTGNLIELRSELTNAAELITNDANFESIIATTLTFEKLNSRNTTPRCAIPLAKKTPVYPTLLHLPTIAGPHYLFYSIKAQKLPSAPRSALKHTLSCPKEPNTLAVAGKGAPSNKGGTETTAKVLVRNSLPMHILLKGTNLYPHRALWLQKTLLDRIDVSTDSVKSLSTRSLLAILVKLPYPTPIYPEATNSPYTCFPKQGGRVDAGASNNAKTPTQSKAMAEVRHISLPTTQYKVLPLLRLASWHNGNTLVMDLSFWTTPQLSHVEIGTCTASLLRPKPLVTELDVQNVPLTTSLLSVHNPSSNMKPNDATPSNSRRTFLQAEGAVAGDAVVLKKPTPAKPSDKAIGAVAKNAGLMQEITAPNANPTAEAAGAKAAGNAGGGNETERATATAGNEEGMPLAISGAKRKGGDLQVAVVATSILSFEDASSPYTMPTICETERSTRSQTHAAQLQSASINDYYAHATDLVSRVQIKKEQLKPYLLPSIIHHTNPRINAAHHRLTHALQGNIRYLKNYEIWDANKRLQFITFRMRQAAALTSSWKARQTPTPEMQRSTACRNCRVNVQDPSCAPGMTVVTPDQADATYSPGREQCGNPESNYALNLKCIGWEQKGLPHYTVALNNTADCKSGDRFSSTCAAAKLPQTKLGITLTLDPLQHHDILITVWVLWTHRSLDLSREVREPVRRHLETLAIVGAWGLVGTAVIGPQFRQAAFRLFGEEECTRPLDARAFFVVKWDSTIDGYLSANGEATHSAIKVPSIEKSLIILKTNILTVHIVVNDRGNIWTANQLLHHIFHYPGSVFISTLNAPPTTTYNTILLETSNTTPTPQRILHITTPSDSEPSTIKQCKRNALAKLPPLFIYKQALQLTAQHAWSGLRQHLLPKITSALLDCLLPAFLQTLSSVCFLIVWLFVHATTLYVCFTTYQLYHPHVHIKPTLRKTVFNNTIVRALKRIQQLHKTKECSPSHVEPELTKHHAHTAALLLFLGTLLYSLGFTLAPGLNYMAVMHAVLKPILTAIRLGAYVTVFSLGLAALTKLDLFVLLALCLKE